MRDKSACRGQTLLETALVLPLLGGFVFGVVWLICLAHNTVVLEKIALDKARLVSADPGALLLPSGTSLLWGNSSPIVSHRKTQLIQKADWRAFIPSLVPPPPAFYPSVQTEPGRFVRVECWSTLSGRSDWTSYLGLRLLKTSAETFLEAPLPPDA